MPRTCIPKIIKIPKSYFVVMSNLFIKETLRVKFEKPIYKQYLGIFNRPYRSTWHVNKYVKLSSNEKA